MTIRSLTATVALALALAGGVTFAPRLRAETPAASTPRVSVLEGAANFRDLGGYVTADGRRVRKALVYRSNHLANLTAADYATLNRLGIALVCDLRTNAEQRRSPTAWQGGKAPEIMQASIMKENSVVLSAERLKELAANTGTATLASSYAQMVTPSAAAEYGRVYRRLVEGNLPTITHCTAGKDRTGVYSAVLLTLLGVPRQAVIEDYMLTGDYMLAPKALARAADDWQKLTGATEPPSEQTMRALYGMHAEVLAGTFGAIDTRWGSFDAFVRDGLKLTPADITTLKARLLE